VTVIGKAFWDVGRASKDGSNRRKRLPECAVWEIHPVMNLNYWAWKGWREGARWLISFSLDL